MILMGIVLTAGSFLFRQLGGHADHSLIGGIYETWRLILGEMPEELPRSRILQALLFLIPIIGLTVIVEGIVDFAWILRDRRRYERGWCLMMAASMKDHIVLVGLGKVGVRTYNLLHGLGEQVVVIERNPQNPFLDEVRRNGDPLLVGDGRRDELLHEANIEKARSIIVATDDDLANLEISLDARRLRPGIRVVLRMFDQTMADKIAEGFDIHLAISTAAIAAPNFAMASIDPTIVSSFVLDGRLIVMLRWTVHEGGPLHGKTVGELQEQLGFGVAQHTRQGQHCLFPGGATQLTDGDEILVQGPYEELVELRSRDCAPPASPRRGEDMRQLRPSSR